jgi:hypothetical protein
MNFWRFVRVGGRSKSMVVERQVLFERVYIFGASTNTPQLKLSTA